MATLPERPRLGDVGFITWCFPNEHLSPRPELEALIPGFKPAFASDDFVVQKRACQLGLGALLLPRTRHPYDGESELVVVECGFPPVEVEMFLVCAKSMEHVPRVRTVADALIRELDRLEPF